MRTPHARGASVDDNRLKMWLRRFAAYRHAPTEEDVRNWLGRFKTNDRDIAARILDCTEVVSAQRIIGGYAEAAKRLPGWHPNPSQRTGRWVFVGLGQAGESGQSMVREFREANGLSDRKYQSLFCEAASLPSLRLKDSDNVVFIDDFAGTGSQVCSSWPEVALLLGANCNLYLILTAVTEKASRRISQQTPFNIIAHIILKDRDSFFNSDHFTPAERQSILAYCQQADKRAPKGYGDCGLLFVLAHKTPNNSLPILHVSKKKWRGLFPRILRPASESA
jgi:hypothetical protein